MITDLEKQFFDTFGIPQLCCKEYITNCLKYGECEECKNYDSTFGTYPQITDRILLELICIFRQHKEMSYFTSVQELKKTLLADFIKYYDRKINARTYAWLIKDAKQIKQQVQALFKEG